MLAAIRLLPVVWVLVGATFVDLAQAQSLGDLWQIQPGRGRRVSSANKDPRSNFDFLTLESGQTAVLSDIRGPGLITHIWFTIDAEDATYPRHLILRAWWDDEQTPSIEVPLGDFFAVGNGLRANVNSEAVQVSSEGRALNCFWPMPFARRAMLTVENQSAGRVHALYYYIDYLELPRLPEPLATFHVQYRQQYPVIDGQDYVFAEITGQGHYVGTVLSWWSVERGWPGEGDDRFYVDGETEPSIVGTGTEDYFSDAWGFRLFTQLDHGVTVWEDREEGARCTAYRWHIRDPIRFTKSLRATIEHRGWAVRNGKWDGFAHRADRFSSGAFWYQVEPHAAFPPLPPAAERMPYSEVRIELEDRLEQASVGSAEVKPSRQQGRLWSNRAQVFYPAVSQEEAWIKVPFTVAQPGRYLVFAMLTVSYDFGIWEILLDGEKVWGPKDMYSPSTQVHEELLGTRELEAGQHWLEVRTVGKNAVSSGVYMGLDALMLRQ